MAERTRLGLWIWLPFLAWIAVWIAALSTPAADCEGGTDAGTEEAVLVALVAAASLVAGVAALWRFVSLSTADALNANRDLTLAGGIVVALGVVAVASPRVEVLAVVGLVGLLASSGIGC